MFFSRSLAKMKSVRFSLGDSIISLLCPCHSLWPSWMKMMFSPMPITEFMSCVLMMVVMLNSCVMPCSRSSITSDVLGSRPELGSSQKRYLGFRAMALAMATRFCMPPEISPGYLSSASTRFTRSRHVRARRMRSRTVMAENISRGNMTFCSTVIESNSAALWNSMPISRRSIIFSCFVMLPKSRPS